MVEDSGVNESVGNFKGRQSERKKMSQRWGMKGRWIWERGRGGGGGAGRRGERGTAIKM